ncbi:MAG: phytoene/squalene synthase family protein [Solirubrobacteraceae bacterium]
MDAGLRASYEACRRMQRRHDPTYYWATRRLPADVRPAVHALYGYVRTADELVDGPRRPAAPCDRRAALDRWEAALREGRAAGGSPQPVIAALVDAERRHGLPLDELDVYMASMRLDCDPVRIDTYRDLEAYMNGSAASVGRIMAPLLGAPEERREDFARLGMAFQLTNFIRDVREDWSLDRVYLPRDDRERFGVTEHDLAGARATPGLRALLAFETARARALFAEGAAAVEAVPPRVRPGMRIARAVYLRVLDRVEAIGFEVLGRRTTLPPWDVGRALVGARRPAAGAA